VDRDAFARSALGDGDGGADEWIAYHDSGAGQHRCAVVRGGRLAGCLFVARPPRALPSCRWLASLFDGEALDAPDRAGLLAGARPNGGDDDGAVVCACFGVGINRLLAAIAGQRLTTVEAVGEALRAGTNCGSCKPEIAALIARHGEAACSESSAA
jgi:assimilatory nitrate reductase catalytic subunit